ncbi:MAG: PG0541 family transporter-associated protein [Treponema sp.]
MNNYRVEIVANQSVEDDITELLEEEIPELEYTVIPTVHGQGLHTKKLGSSTWPEQNFLMFTYVDKKKASAIKNIIAKIRERFPKEGISFFCVEEAEL